MRNIIVFVTIILCLSILICPVEAKSKSKKKDASAPQRIECATDDHFNIIGNVFLPPDKAEGTRVPMVILLHGIAENKNVWTPFAKDLAKKGYAVVVPDMRGHGESIWDSHHKKLVWRRFSKEDWLKNEHDIVNLINNLKHTMPEINTDKSVIIGASIGSSLAVITAGNKKADIKGLILLSPFSNYKGLETRVSLVDYGKKPILMAVSKTDISSYNDVKELTKYAQGEHEVVLLKNAGHGTDILKFEPKMKDIIYKWLAEKLPPTAEKLPKGTSPTKKKPSKKHH